MAGTGNLILKRGINMPYNKTQDASNPVTNAVLLSGMPAAQIIGSTWPLQTGLGTNETPEQEGIAFENYPNRFWIGTDQYAYQNSNYGGGPELPDIFGTSIEPYTGQTTPTDPTTYKSRPIWMGAEIRAYTPLHEDAVDGSNDETNAGTSRYVILKADWERPSDYVLVTQKAIATMPLRKYYSFVDQFQNTVSRYVEFNVWNGTNDEQIAASTIYSFPSSASPTENYVLQVAEVIPPSGDTPQIVRLQWGAGGDAGAMSNFTISDNSTGSAQIDNAETIQFVGASGISVSVASGTPNVVTITGSGDTSTVSGINGSDTSSAFKVPFTSLTGPTATNANASSGLLVDTTNTLTYNPNTNTLTATNFAGNASTATSATSATSATTATNLSGGIQGSIPYQTAANTTTFLEPTQFTSGALLQSQGLNQNPVWASPENLSVGNADVSNASSVASSTDSSLFLTYVENNTDSAQQLKYNSNVYVVGTLTSPSSNTKLVAPIVATTIVSPLSAVDLLVSTSGSTLNLKSSTTINLEATSKSSSSTINVGNYDVTSGNTKTINIGTSTGSGTTTNVTIGSDTGTSTVIIKGNLQVDGTTTTVNTETVTIDDNIIVLNDNATGTPTLDAGIEIERGDSSNVSLLWDESATKWSANRDGTNLYPLTISDSSSELHTDGISDADSQTNGKSGRQYIHTASIKHLDVKNLVMSGTWTLNASINSALDLKDGGLKLPYLTGTFHDSNAMITLAEGQIAYDTASDRVVYNRGDNNVDGQDESGNTLAVVVDENATQTLTNKTIDNIKASGANATTSLHTEVSTGTIAVGSGITSGSITIAGSSSLSGTVNIANGAISTGTKAINIGTGGTAGTTNITLGANTTGTTAINSQTFNASNATSISLGANSGTATINNTTLTAANATTVNLGTSAGSATTVNIGNASNSGNTLEFNSTASGTVNVTTDVTSGTVNLFNSNATVVNFAGAATTLIMGATSAATTTIRGGTLVGNTSAQSVFDTTATQVDAFGAATTLTLGHDGASGSTTNIATGNTGGSLTKLINIGTGSNTDNSTTRIVVGGGTAATATCSVLLGCPTASTSNVYVASNRLVFSNLETTSNRVVMSGPSSTTDTSVVHSLPNVSSGNLIVAEAANVNITAGTSGSSTTLTVTSATDGSIKVGKRLGYGSTGQFVIIEEQLTATNAAITQNTASGTTYSVGDTSIVLATGGSLSSIAVGQLVSGTGIAEGTYVIGLNSTRIYLSKAVSSPITTVTALSFRRPGGAGTYRMPSAVSITGGTTMTVLGTFGASEFILTGSGVTNTAAYTNPLDLVVGGVYVRRETSNVGVGSGSTAVKRYPIPFMASQTGDNPNADWSSLGIDGTSVQKAYLYTDTTTSNQVINSNQPGSYTDLTSGLFYAVDDDGATGQIGTLFCDYIGAMLDCGTYA